MAVGGQSTIAGVAFVLFAPLAFIVLWLGLRWPLRRVLLVSLVLGLVADVLFDILATRNR
jgi:hypothetical protein